MIKSEYFKMYLLEDSHFWFVGKRFFIQSYFNSIKRNIHNILDVGCGTGGATKFLEKYGRVTGLEKNNYAISLARKRRLKIIKGEAEKLPFKAELFDLITVLDVLYHKDVKNVKKVVFEAKKVLQPGGYLLITDSALDFFKGNHSSSVYEKRRFTISRLKTILDKEGFITVKSSYIYFSIFPLVLFKRLFLDRLNKLYKSDIKQENFFINCFLLFILKIESIFLGFISFPIGSSLIILAKNEKS